MTGVPKSYFPSPQTKRPKPKTKNWLDYFIEREMRKMPALRERS